MTEAMPFLQKYDITFLRPPAIPEGRFFRLLPQQRCHIIGQWCGDIKTDTCQRVHKVQREGMEGGTQDIAAALAVKPVSRKGMADGGHVYAKLVCAARVGDEPQQRESVFA